VYCLSQPLLNNMSRRKQSLFKRVTAAAAWLPWWLAVGLAVAAYWGLHYVASNELTAVVLSGNLEGFDGHPRIQVMLAIGQYLLPAIFLLLAMMSAYGHYADPESRENMTMTPRQSVLQSMSWPQFELLIGEAFRRKGYSIVEKGGPGSRVDFVLKKSNEIFLVQCKQWRAIRVGANTVRELEVVMRDRGAKNGLVVTSGEFTGEALDLAKNRNIELMDGKALRALTRGVSVPTKVFRDPLSILTRGIPFCPECQGRMVKKKVRSGPHEGQLFWRCMRHPDCKGKRVI